MALELKIVVLPLFGSCLQEVLNVDLPLCSRKNVLYSESCRLHVPFYIALWKKCCN